MPQHSRPNLKRKGPTGKPERDKVLDLRNAAHAFGVVPGPDGVVRNLDIEAKLQEFVGTHPSANARELLSVVRDHVLTEAGNAQRRCTFESWVVVSENEVVEVTSHPEVSMYWRIPRDWNDAVRSLTGKVYHIRQQGELWKTMCELDDPSPEQFLAACEYFRATAFECARILDPSTGPGDTRPGADPELGELREGIRQTLAEVEALARGTLSNASEDDRHLEGILLDAANELERLVLETGHASEGR